MLNLDEIKKNYENEMQKFYIMEAPWMVQRADSQ